MNFTKYNAAGKDYICLTDKNCFSILEKSDKKLLCDRHEGIGADGIFAFNQNFSEFVQIKGFLSNDKLLRDYSSASICAFFEAFLTQSAIEHRFSFKNSEISVGILDKSADFPLISCKISSDIIKEKYPLIMKPTEIGNRILTLTVISFHDIFAVHFSECKDKLKLSYLGEHLSHNSFFSKQANLILAQKVADNIYEIDFYENSTSNPRPTVAAFGAVAISACLTGKSSWGKETEIFCNSKSVKAIPLSLNECIIITEVKKIYEGTYTL